MAALAAAARHAQPDRGAAARADGHRRRHRSAARRRRRRPGLSPRHRRGHRQPAVRLLLGFLEQYLREGMRITKGNEARRADFMAQVQPSTAPSSRPSRRATPWPRGATRTEHLLRGEQRLVEGGIIAAAGAARRQSAREHPPSRRETIDRRPHETADHRRRRLRRRPPGAHAAEARHVGRPADRAHRADRHSRRRPADLLADPRVEARTGPLLDADRCAAHGGLRRRVPPRLGRVGRVRGRFRPRHALQPRQHARPARCLRATSRGRQRAALRVLEFGGGVRARRRPCRCPSSCADDTLPTPQTSLRHAEAGLRAPDRRLHAQGLRRRPRRAADDRDGAAGQAQRRRLVVLQRHHPRAAGRRGSDLPGRPDGVAPGVVARPHRRRPDRRLRSQPRSLRRPRARSTCRRSTCA